jgi:GT2 family glycosyltransferase
MATQSSSLPIVSIVVLSHARAGCLGRVLDSIAQQSYPNIEVIVVDNKSNSSAEIARIVHSYQGVKLLQNDDNLGYTGGMNRGLAAASGRYVHFTVDDVIFAKTCIAHLAEYMERQPSVGLLSGILYNEEGLIDCAGGRVDLAPVYAHTIFGAGEKDIGQFSAPYTVKYISGAMIFGRVDLLKRLKGFRRDFFIYCEDSELCARVSKLGYDLAVVPQAKATALDEPHAFTSEGIAFHKIKNFFALYLLHARLRVLPEFFLRYGVISFPKYLLTNRKMVWPLMKAWGWFLFKTPSLLWERFRSRSLAAVFQSQ